tara:strand:+ start:41195 stop:41452 length:258 start_codon:yes stop_codon:yes gene_type:complete
MWEKMKKISLVTIVTQSLVAWFILATVQPFCSDSYGLLGEWLGHSEFNSHVLMVPTVLLIWIVLSLAANILVLMIRERTNGWGVK